MKRIIEKKLINWKNSKDHMVLLVRGARQVGKTHSIRQLGQTFEHFVEVNFEKQKDIHVFFKKSLDPLQLINKLSAFFSTPITPGKTLLFFDEIQACPEAFGSLRFFYESIPDLHVAAAGSLLEIAMEQLPSQGVGRITSLFMYPLSFSEFLMAMGEDRLLTLVSQASPENPLDPPFHERLVDHIKTFQLIGGFPKVVQKYVAEKNIHDCFKILDDLIVTLEDDFAKYKNRSPVHALSDVYQSLAFQCGQKFKYAGIRSGYSHATLKMALDLLIKAGLAHRICHTSASGLPLGAQADETRFKILPADTGIMQRQFKTDIPSYLTASDFGLINKGALAECAAGLELIKYQPQHMRPSLYYWHREQRASTAEVDYVIQRGATILPIEVKAGTKGQMQSLYLFLKEKKLSQGIRISLENFSSYDMIEVVPLYAVSNIRPLP